MFLWFRRLVVDTLVAFGIMKVIQAGLESKPVHNMVQRIKTAWSERHMSKYERMIRDGQL